MSTIKEHFTDKNKGCPPQKKNAIHGGKKNNTRTDNTVQLFIQTNLMWVLTGTVNDR